MLQARLPRAGVANRISFSTVEWSAAAFDERADDGEKMGWCPIRVLHPDFPSRQTSQDCHALICVNEKGEAIRRIRNCD